MITNVSFKREGDTDVVGRGSLSSFSAAAGRLPSPHNSSPSGEGDFRRKADGVLHYQTARTSHSQAIESPWMRLPMWRLFVEGISAAKGHKRLGQPHWVPLITPSRSEYPVHQQPRHQGE